MFRLVVIAACIVTVLGDDIARECTHSTGVLPKSFEVVGCTSTPCVLHQLEDAVINVTFDAPNNASSLSVELTTFLTLGNISIPLPIDLGFDEVCTGLTNATCPVTAGQELKYTLIMPVQAYFPVDASFQYELRVVDATEPAFCARSSVLIAAPKIPSTSL